MFEIKTLLILIVALPLASALLTAALGPKLLRGNSHAPTVLALLISFLCSVMLLVEVRYAQNLKQADPSTPAKAVVRFDDFAPLWTWASVPDAFDSRRQESPPTRGTGWQPVPTSFTIDITLRADALTSLMLVMVTFISLLVAIYSIGYMHGDRGYWRFFTYISLFVFSMCMLVTVSNFLLLYVFWEAVGVCSYLLIGFWYEKNAAAAAGKKAFLVNRVGDFGFALAIFLIFITYGTLNFHDTPWGTSPDVPIVEQNASLVTSGDVPHVAGVLGETALKNPEKFYIGGGVGLAICLLLMLGACGKSAQFPLHVWLPDAMEGPTPVSALIHAATMVTAGVYMVARCTPLFMVSPTAQLTVACIGGFTALMAALIALTQFDLKRVLAYSTISQLGYMFLALGCGTFAGVSSGMFHMLTHAFFKALLFLGAGSVMHAMGGVIDMRRFGGLRKKLWITCVTFGIGCIALAGIPPLAGFWSKDAILAVVLDRSHSQAPYGWVFNTLFWAAVVTAGLTAFYTFRAFFLTFFGRENIPDEAAGHAHESPPVMWIPLAILAFFAIVAGGFSVLYSPEVDSFLVHTPSLANELVRRSAHHGDHTFVALVSIAVAALGVALAAYVYLVPAGTDERKARPEVAALSYILRFQWLERCARISWVDWLASRPLVRGVHSAADKIGLGWLASLLGWLVLLVVGLALSPLLLLYYCSPHNLSQNKFYWDEIYYASVVWPLERLARLSDLADHWLVDGTINFLGWLPRAIGSLLRSLQMGLTPFYALAMVLGLAVMLAMGAIWVVG